MFSRFVAGIAGRVKSKPVLDVLNDRFGFIYSGNDETLQWKRCVSSILLCISEDSFKYLYSFLNHANLVGIDMFMFVAS